MRIAIFGGSFDPPHKEHVRFLQAAIKSLALDRVFVMPSACAPHKKEGAFAGEEARFEMCRLAFRGVEGAEVSDFEQRSGGVSYSYLTCRAFKEKYPTAERYFLIGADMLEDFFTWRNPEEILACVTLAVCGRESEISPSLTERFEATFHKSFERVDFIGKPVSSTRIRTEIAFGKKPKETDDAVYAYLWDKKLYSYPAVLPALSLETPERREHSFRVALLATARARSLRIPERKALLAGALHDCGKYVPLSSPLLKGFVPPDGVPAPVLHQYTGAYLAEHEFGVTDEEILGAIRYHTSGKEGMTALEKLVYLADLLEEGRTFQGVEELRELFWRDLDACLKKSLEEQIKYLKETGRPIYALTKAAYRYAIKE